MLAIVLASPAHEESAIPSGMDVLYGDRVAVTASGEPLVAIGVVGHQNNIVFKATRGLVADFYEAGIAKRTTFRAGQRLEFRVIRAQAAPRRHYVDLRGTSFRQRSDIEQDVQLWKSRGYAAQIVEEGQVLGIGGRVIDNRQLRLIITASDEDTAKKLSQTLHKTYGVRSTVETRLRERPWGEIAMLVDGARFARATSYFRLRSEDGPIYIKGVEFGAGYAWHGFEDRQFAGEIYVVVDPDGALAVVNLLEAEKVLEGVVPAEIFPSAHIEALKAQAVAARNQLFAKLGRRHHADPFHLCSEQHCQVYVGTQRADERVSQAVQETQGEVLFLGEQLVDTVYSSSCGGHTENNEVVWGNAADPALRGQSDLLPTQTDSNERLEMLHKGHLETWLAMPPESYCSAASKANPQKYRWQKTFGTSDLQEIASYYPTLGALRGLQIVERGEGGRVISIELIGSKNSVKVFHELNIRKLFGNLNSGAFNIEQSVDLDGNLQNAIFYGAGWGHGVGMCQMGAVGRAEAGQDYQSILAHYYNGARVQRLYGVNANVVLTDRN